MAVWPAGVFLPVVLPHSMSGSDWRQEMVQPCELTDTQRDWVTRLWHTLHLPHLAVAARGTRRLSQSTTPRCQQGNYITAIRVGDRLHESILILIPKKTVFQIAHKSDYNFMSVAKCLQGTDVSQFKYWINNHFRTSCSIVQLLNLK